MPCLTFFGLSLFKIGCGSERCSHFWPYFSKRRAWDEAASGVFKRNKDRLVLSSTSCNEPAKRFPNIGNISYVQASKQRQLISTAFHSFCSVTCCVIDMNMQWKWTNLKHRTHFGPIVQSPTSGLIFMTWNHLQYETCIQDVLNFSDHHCCRCRFLLSMVSPTFSRIIMVCSSSVPEKPPY